jgi:predicted permease
VVGDLDEEYTRYVRPRRGRFGADLWYWRQVVRSAGPLWARRSSVLNGDLRGDVARAVRTLSRRPGLSTAVVLSLALGVGANTAVFAVVHGVLLRPLPFAHADRVVRPLPESLFFVDASQVETLRERLTTIDELAGWGRSLFLFESDDDAVEVRGGTVDWNHFTMLGATAAVGRTFVRQDAAARDAIVLSHGLWQRRFGGDPGIVGSTTIVSGRSVRVVGVMGPDHVPMETDWEAWWPNPADPGQATNALAVNLRMREGGSLEEVEAEFRSVWLGMLEEARYDPSAEERAAMVTVPVRRWLLGDARGSLVVAAVAAALVLLLACVNVTNLLMAHFGRRRREFGIRAAVGGGKGAVARTALLEVAILAVVGGVLGVSAAAWIVEGSAVRLSGDLPRVAGVRFSLPVLLFGTAAAVCGAFLAGLWPALRAARSGSRSWVGSRGASRGLGGLRARAALVGCEVAFAVVLVVGTALLARSWTVLHAVDPGFDAEGVVTVRPAPPASRYEGGEALEDYYRRVMEALEGVPGVQSVAAIQFLPMTSGGWWSSYRAEGTLYGADEARPRMAVRLITPGYLETMRIGLRDGRDLTDDDGVGDELGILVNETLARAAFPDGRAVGSVLWLGGDDDQATRVVGVVEDVRQTDLRTPPHPEIYLPTGYTPWRRLHLAVRAEGDLHPMLPAVAAAVRSIDPAVHIEGPSRMTDTVGRTWAELRLLTALLAGFGAIAVMLGALGVYGVTAQAVAERVRAIGVRMALGARGGAVARATVVEGLVPVVVGLVGGLVVSAAAVHGLEAQLFGVAVYDPWSFLAAPLLLLLVAIAAIAIPAVRAARVDPVRVLQGE